MTNERLEETTTNRGFKHLPPIRPTSGYVMQTASDGGPDWDAPMTPRDHGEIHVYESSEAMYAALWLSVDDGDGKRVAVQMPIERARQLAEQLNHVADHHYQGADD